MGYRARRKLYCGSKGHQGFKFQQAYIDHRDHPYRTRPLAPLLPLKVRQIHTRAPKEY